MMEKEVLKTYIVKVENRYMFLYLTFSMDYFLFNGGYLNKITEEEAKNFLNQ